MLDIKGKIGTVSESSGKLTFTLLSRGGIFGSSGIVDILLNKDATQGLIAHIGKGKSLLVSRETLNLFVGKKIQILIDV